MANATILNSEMSLDGDGQRGKREIRGTASWPTTNATCTLPLPGMTRLDNLQLTPIGTVASDEIQSWSDTLVNGAVGLDTANPVANMTRTGASKTSALKFAFRATGR